MSFLPVSDAQEPQEDDTVPKIEPPGVDETLSNAAAAAQPPLACDAATAFTGYLSDEPKDVIDSSSDNDDNDDDSKGLGGDGHGISNKLPVVRPLKRRKLDVPARAQKRINKERCGDDRRVALEAIEKLLKSKKTNHLALIIKRGRSSIDASERAAETHGFAPIWGGRQLRSWTHAWVSKRELPQSLAGRHAKVYSLLGDPVVAAELHAYVRSNKWVVNPEKLAQFSKDKLIPSEAEKYLHALVDDEMPCGLKKYLELELFPRIHLKVGRGISLATARRWLQREAQSNDAVDQYWVFEDQFKLRKKGVGRGLHHSDVICSIVGHMVDAGESLEYGKNHEGYWNGEMFVKQVGLSCRVLGKAFPLIFIQLSDKIIPTFERIHGPGYQALFLIDNSQGHSAYAEDALLVSRMNVNPGGKQAHMRPGWFIHDGMRIEQDMVFPPDHPQFPNEAKGIKQFHCELNFIEYFWGKTLKKNMPLAMQSVQLSMIQLWEHRMHRWMEAYRTGLSTKDAQFQVKQFSSTKYKSHRRIPETLARIFD
ncbi:hypothetical protein C8R48DRAFT_750082 [Suillus tomentosus]|nr:hypothetical protein C8R48DRAFT_750082 [Suillus tomentosus]